MDFLSKCKVLGELWIFYQEESKTSDAWTDFFTYNDIALPSAHIITEGYVNPVEGSMIYEFIDETWDMFCEYIDIDPNGNYDGIISAWNASSQPPLNQVEEIKEEITVEEKPVRKRSTKKATPPEWAARDQTPYNKTYYESIYEITESLPILFNKKDYDKAWKMPMFEI